MKYKVDWWVNMGMLSREGVWEFDEEPSEEELHEWMDTEISNYVDAGYNRQ